MKTLTLAGLFLASTLLVSLPARAQTNGATAVANNTCPTSNYLNAGNNRPLVETQYGQLCVQIAGGSLTPSGLQNVNVTQYGSTAVVTGGIAGTVGVGGTSASGSADDSSYPVKIGGVTVTTAGSLPSNANGAKAQAVFDARGNLRALMTGTQDPNKVGQGVNSTFVNSTTNSNSYSPLATTPFLYNGTNQDGAVSITGALAAGATGVGTAAVEDAGTSFAEITSATTTLVKSGATILHNVNVGTCVASATIKIYNALTATGTPITITCGATVDSLPTKTYNYYFSTGITVVTSGATDVTIGYGR